MKRALDVLVTIAAAPIILPLIVSCALLVLVTLGWPVFYLQVRAGNHGKPFRMIKCRSMLDSCDSEGRLPPDHERLTPIPRWLRSTSLDELPEFFNVLVGDMSLVGPRPLLMEYLPRYSPEQARRHMVLPGITGWAQINGRNAIDWEDKFALDVWYVDHQSITLDLSILWLTIWRVLKREGVSYGAQDTMPPFLGSDCHHE